VAPLEQPAERLDRPADGGEALRVRVEQPKRPIGSREGTRHDVGDGGGALLDEGILLRGECRQGVRVRISVDDHTKPALGDARQHDDGDVERRAANLREPEAALLDEVEGEPVAPGRPGGEYRRVELDLFARRDGTRQGCPDPIPEDRVSEWVEPVIGDLDAGPAA